jgi:hypothetical protein
VKLGIAIVAASLLLAACAKEGERQAKSTNEQFEVVQLFRVDGCTVYRFYDFAAYRYFVSCSGGAQWREGCGKSCTRDVDVPTAVRP